VEPEKPRLSPTIQKANDPVKIIFKLAFNNSTLFFTIYINTKFSLSAMM
jgi:hypothetical protein